MGSSSSRSKNTIPNAAIVGIICAVVVLIVIVAIIVFLLWRKTKRAKLCKPETVPAPDPDYAVLATRDDEAPPGESSQYARVEFRKSEKYKDEKKKVKEIKKQKPGENDEGPIYAKIRAEPNQPDPPPDSPEPRYANINIQSSVWNY